MKTKKITIGMILVMAVLSATTVLAFGVSSPYWEGNPLTICPGETKTALLGYQNLGEGVADVTIKAEITRGNEIASLKEQDYVVAANTRDTQVDIDVSIPESAPIGAEYKITLTSRTVTPGTEGGVGLGVGIDTTFDVLVVEKPAVQEEILAEETPETGLAVIFVLLAVIIVSVILLIVIHAKKSKKITKK